MLKMSSPRSQAQAGICQSQSRARRIPLHVRVRFPKLSCTARTSLLSSFPTSFKTHKASKQTVKPRDPPEAYGAARPGGYRHRSSSGSVNQQRSLPTNPFPSSAWALLLQSHTSVLLNHSQAEQRHRFDLGILCHPSATERASRGTCAFLDDNDKNKRFHVKGDDTSLQKSSCSKGGEESELQPLEVVTEQTALSGQRRGNAAAPLLPAAYAANRRTDQRCQITGQAVNHVALSPSLFGSQRQTLIDSRQNPRLPAAHKH